MTTPRIEEMVEEVARKMGFRTEASFHTETIRQALTEAHQAGRDEAVEKIKSIEKGIEWMQEGFVKDRKGYTKGYNQALDDTITALQDNK